MILADGALGLLLVGLWIFCIIDVITTDEVAMRNLPKPVWLLIVIFLFDLGAILWLIAGRPWQQTGRRAAARPSAAFPEYDRPGRFAATNPDDDEDFLRQVRERAEEQRRRYRDQQAEARRLEEQDEHQRREQRSTDDGDA